MRLVRYSLLCMFILLQNHFCVNVVVEITLTQYLFECLQFSVINYNNEFEKLKGMHYFTDV